MNGRCMYMTDVRICARRNKNGERYSFIAIMCGPCREPNLCGMCRERKLDEIMSRIDWDEWELHVENYIWERQKRGVQTTLELLGAFALCYFLSRLFKD